ncbi:hypothetical protein C2E23DRAFT_861177 [Lenzites betulinus]|nr:hypothetical protein C2E23DRAFT_861177 [Lenzites betulinus]
MKSKSIEKTLEAFRDFLDALEVGDPNQVRLRNKTSSRCFENVLSSLAARDSALDLIFGHAMQHMSAADPFKAQLFRLCIVRVLSPKTRTPKQRVAGVADDRQIWTNPTSPSVMQREDLPSTHDLSYAVDYNYDGDDGDEDDEEALVVPSTTCTGSAQPASHRSSASGAPASLYEAQLALQIRDERIRELEIQSAQAKQSARRKRQAKRKKTVTDESPDNSEGSDTVASDAHELRPLLEIIKRHARKYSACYRPWPPPDQVWEFPARPNVDPRDPQARYPTTGTSEQKSNALVLAYAAELYDNNPSLLHPHMQNQWLISRYKHTILDQKSKTLANACALRKAIFADLPELNIDLFDDMEGNAQAISTDPILTKWRSLPADIYPPIIFPEGKAGQMKYIFRCSAIANFTRVSILGKGSLQKHGKFRPRSNTSAIQWKVTSVSAGMIAFAAVAVGSTTGVNYEYIFDQYMKLLSLSWESPRMTQTRAWLEERVFKGLKNALPPTAAPANPDVRTYVELDDLDELNDPGSESDPVDADSELAFAPPAATSGPSPVSINAPAPTAPRTPVPYDIPQAVVPPPSRPVQPHPSTAVVPPPSRPAQPHPSTVAVAPPPMPISAPTLAAPPYPTHVAPPSAPPSAPLPPPQAAPRPAPRPVRRNQPPAAASSQPQDDFNNTGLTSATAPTASEWGDVRVTGPPASSASPGALAETLHRVSLAGDDPVDQDPAPVAPAAKRRGGGRGAAAGRGRGAIQMQEAPLDASEPNSFYWIEPTAYSQQYESS